MTIINTLVPCTADALLGSEIAQVTGNDVDSGPVLWYVLSPSGPQDPFSVGRYGGRLSLTGPLDFEQRDRYHLQLLAHDGPHEGQANLTVFVEDVNDNSPAFSSGLASNHFLMCTPQLDRSEMITELYREEKKEEGGRGGQQDKRGE